VKQRYQFDLSDYASLEKIFELLKDVLTLGQELRSTNRRPDWAKVASTLRPHSKLLVPVFGFAAEYITKQLPIDEASRQFLLNKISFIVDALSISFRYASVLIFLYQVSILYILQCRIYIHTWILIFNSLYTKCYELYTINESIRQAMSVISDEEVKSKFVLIEQKITRLKEIVDEIDRLFVLWQEEV